MGIIGWLNKQGGTLLHRGCSAIKADRDAIDLLLVRGADVRALDEVDGFSICCYP